MTTLYKCHNSSNCLLHFFPLFAPGTLTWMALFFHCISKYICKTSKQNKQKQKNVFTEFFFLFCFRMSFILGVAALPLIGGVLSALVFLLFVGVAVICAQRKKQNKLSTKQKGTKLPLTYFSLTKNIFLYLILPRKLWFFLIFLIPAVFNWV